MNEIWNFSLSIDDIAAVTDGFGHGTWTTGEYTHFAHIAVLFLNKLEEWRHVGSPEMVDGSQSGEHAPLGQSLEVIFANIQHGGPEVKLVVELCDEDVHLQDVGNIFLLHISEDIYEPLEVFMGRADPEEVDFLASNARISVGRCSKDQII